MVRGLPGDDVYLAAAVGDDCRLAVTKRCVDVAVHGKAPVAVARRETAVERRKEERTLSGGNTHRPTRRSDRRLVSSWIESQRRPGMVDPRDVSNHARIRRI